MRQSLLTHCNLIARFVNAYFHCSIILAYMPHDLLMR
jgi:hypothetical protein